MKQISIEEFEQVCLATGTIIQCRFFDKARKPAYQLWIDLGDWGIRQSSAQITALYTPEKLIGRQVICVVNIIPRIIAGFRSEVLVTGFSNQDGDIVLAVPDCIIPNGKHLH
ncbi:MAG: tRNA-binding protein [Candidatus Competibacteraceae bacterium]|nr:tRNA-binding protein [Candidatus Competibacteraceae bacterium]